MTCPTQALADAGVSIWLDDLSRARIDSGDLADLVRTRNVTGVTTNPTIFQTAIADGGGAYAAALERLTTRHVDVDVDAAIFALTTADVRDACDVLRPVFDATGGVDGRVSIEVSPDLAHDTAATVAEAKKLYAAVARPNVMIKIPATPAGLPAITEVIGDGISVNATLIFSLARYSDVIDAYLAGIRVARRNRIDLTTIHSVASFFISRVDAAVDRLLTAIGTPEALDLRGRAGVANARLAYDLFQRRFDDEGAQFLLASGANMQRPLWASTGVKDPTLPDTFYVTELVARSTVNTMPLPTLEATADLAVIDGDTITARFADAEQVYARLASLDIDFDEVTQTLEDEGVAKFVDSWNDLRGVVARAIGGR